MVYKNKPRGEQLTKVLLRPPPWRSLAFLASGVPDTGLALSLERHAYHVTAWALVGGNEAAGRAGTSWDRGQVPPSACVPSPNVLTLSGANLNSLTCSANWRRLWPRVICPTLAASPAHWVEAFQKGSSWLGTDNLAQLHAASDLGNTWARGQVETGMTPHFLPLTCPC